MVGLFQNQPAKIIALVISSFGTFIFAPIMFILAKYEKEKQDRKIQESNQSKKMILVGIKKKLIIGKQITSTEKWTQKKL